MPPGGPGRRVGFRAHRYHPPMARPLPSRRPTRLAAAAIVLLVAGVAVASCGGGGSSRDAGGKATTSSRGTGATFTREAYVAELVRRFPIDNPDVPSTPEVDRCAAEVIVDSVGLSTLTTRGVTPEELAQIGTLDDLGLPVGRAARLRGAGKLLRCADLGRLLVPDPTPEEAACIRHHIEGDMRVGEAFLRALLDGADPYSILGDPYLDQLDAACLGSPAA